jgi:hypothetical protein
MYGKPGATVRLAATGAGVYMAPVLVLGIVLIVVGALLGRRSHLRRLG